MRDRDTRGPDRDTLDPLDGWPAGLWKQIIQAANLGLPVILLGETGTGKTHLARQIHALGPRARKPFIPVNCTALAESLIEAELFGHERGAYTGADQSRPGLVEAANGGTLFLDEIAELPLALQAKLLTLLDEEAIRRVGSTEMVDVDVQIICATNRNLRALVTKGEFREDLYYRCKGIQLRLKPLRERRDDIPRLARHLLADIAATRNGNGGPSPDISEDALNALCEQSWPGNLRQLRFALKYAFGNAGRARIERRHFPDDDWGSGPTPPDLIDDGAAPEASLANRRPRYVAPEDPEVERRRIEAALLKTGGNRTRTAAELGMSRQLLWQRMRSYGIT